MAFVNLRNAPFADAFIIFPELVIFIQEKQSVTARKQNASGWIARHQFPTDCVEAELSKISEVMEPDDLFLYVCDNQSGGAPCCIGTNTLLITVEQHSKLQRKTLAWLRASALEVSATRAHLFYRKLIDVCLSP